MHEVEVENAVIASEEALIALVVAVNVGSEHLNEGNTRVMRGHESGDLPPREAVHFKGWVFDHISSELLNFVIETADLVAVNFNDPG